MNGYDCFNVTNIGFNHIKTEKICQDHSSCCLEEGYGLVAVADGHGSSNCPRSDRGSRFACEVVSSLMKYFVTYVDVEALLCKKTQQDVVAQLCKSILAEWHKRIDEDVIREPFSEEELENVAEKYKKRYLEGDDIAHAYGSTLVFAVVTEHFFLAIRNGDGRCVSVSLDGNMQDPIPWNEKCEFNITTSLCDANAIHEFRSYVSEDKPAAVFVSTDGVDDSYTSLEELFSLYQNICLRFSKTDIDTIYSEVNSFLPVLTEKGSGDDVSIAGLLCVDSISALRDYLQDEQSKRAVVAQRAQQQQEKEKEIRINERARYETQKALRQAKERKETLLAALAAKGSLLEKIREKLFSIQKQEESCLFDSESLSKDIMEIDALIQDLQAKADSLNDMIEVQRAQLFSDEKSVSDYDEDVGPDYVPGDSDYRVMDTVEELRYK